jgi:hypothetical protein
LLDALKSKVPFNISFLNNAAIVELIQDSTLPVPLIYDPHGKFLSWLNYRH